jgi:general secretion pathway protein E
MVGEMRAAEAAHIGLHAALTGHLVLTRLHTNTAAGAISV